MIFISYVTGIQKNVKDVSIKFTNNELTHCSLVLHFFYIIPSTNGIAISQAALFNIHVLRFESNYRGKCFKKR